MYRPWAIVMVKDVLAASGLFLRRFFEYDVGDMGQHLLEKIWSISVAR
jgi:hypothetical protein